MSLLIVTRKWSGKVEEFNYIKELSDGELDYEVLLAEGNNPSSQRNILAKKASGDYLLFMDDDSRPIKGILERYRQTLGLYPETEILGGPSLLVENRNPIHGLSKVFFYSSFGIGPLRSRYNSFGQIRKATDSDLILCNLLIKKDFFINTKGFNRNYYPGEENEFLKNHHSNNIIYDPEAIVYRESRNSMYTFMEQMFSYGKGRSKHLRLNSTFEYLFLIPLFFSIYILLLPILSIFSFAWCVPLVVHFALSLYTLLEYRNKSLLVWQKALTPFFFILGHFCYGMGLLCGLGKYKILKKIFLKESPKEEIRIHNLKKFKKNSP